MQAYMVDMRFAFSLKSRLSLAALARWEKEIGYVVRDAKRWDADPERTASEFDAAYYEKLLDKAWEEVAFALKC